MASSTFLDIKAPKNDSNFGYSDIPAAFDAIVEFLNKKIDVSSAAERITEPVVAYGQPEPDSPITMNKPLNSDNDETSETKFSVEYYLWSLWSMLNEIVKQISHDHPWLDDIVDLLAAIKHVELPATKEGLTIWGEKFQWKNLPIFGPNCREDLDRFTPMDNDDSELGLAHISGKVCSAEQFARYAAFLAKVTVRGVADYKLYAIWMLRETLEEQMTSRGLDTHMPAAAAWILYAGVLIYESQEMYEYGPTVGDPAKAGTLWSEKSKHGFCTERWDFWKRKFLEISCTHTKIQPATISYAKLAVAMMNEIEKKDNTLQK